MKKRLEEILNLKISRRDTVYYRRKNWFCRCVKQRDYFAIFINGAGR